MTPVCVGVTDAAALLGVCPRTIREFIDQGVLATVKFPSVKYPGERGKRILILVDDLRAFAEKHRVTP